MKHFNKKTAVYLAIGVVLLSGMLAITVNASKDPVKVEKYVTSVYVRKGDSLWTIAEQYYQKENHSMVSYIEEIKKCNHLIGNQLKEGQNLVVPYYPNMDKKERK